MSFERLRSNNEVLRSRLAKLQVRNAAESGRTARTIGAPSPAMPPSGAGLEARAAMDPGPSAAEQKRRTPRRRGAIPCTVQFEGLRMVLAARIIDMSTGGARLHLPPAAKTAYGGVNGLPDRLVLQIKPDRMEYEAEIAWRSEGEIGVRFTAPPRHMKVTGSPTALPASPARTMR